MKTGWRLWMALPLILCGLPCCARNDRVAKANDVLRERNLNLENQVDALSKRVSELEAEIRAVSAASSPVSPEVLENTPRVARLTISRLSFVRDTDGDGHVDSVYIILQPEDGLSRFVPLVGTLSVTASILPPGGNAQTIGHRVYSPRELRDAYRATITAIHYAIELPITIPPGESAPLRGTCVVQVNYADGYTGVESAVTHEIHLDP